MIMDFNTFMIIIGVPFIILAIIGLLFEDKIGVPRRRDRDD